MEVSIENGKLVIRMPMNANPAPSASGKTLIVATSSGNKPTALMVQGRPVVVGVNAYIPKA